MPPTPRTRQIASPGRMGIISSSSVDARPRGGSEREGSDATRAHLIHELIRRVLDLIPRSHARGRRARGERGAAVAVVASEPRRACRGDVARATLDVGRTAERQLASVASRRVVSSVPRFPRATTRPPRPPHPPARLPSLPSSRRHADAIEEAKRRARVDPPRPPTRRRRSRSTASSRAACCRASPRARSPRTGPHATAFAKRERRSLRTSPGVPLRPSLAFNPRPRRLSTPPLTPSSRTPTFARVERTALTAVVDRASLVASSRAFAEASRGVASLPPSFEFSSMRALGHARMAERHSDIEWRLDALMRTLERVEAGVSKARARAYVDRVDPQVRAVLTNVFHP